MQVSEIMHRGVTTCEITDSLKKVAAMMKREDIGSVPVYKNGRPIGFVTDRDIVITCVANGYPSDNSISHAMTKDVHTINQNDQVELAAKLMKENQISRLLVVDQGDKAVGMLSLHDLTTSVENEQLKLDVISAIKH